MGTSPLVAALAFTAGILAVHGLPALPAPWVLLACGLPALLPWRGRAIWAMALLGVLLTAWRAQGLLDARWPPARHGTDHRLEGTVASLPERSPDSWRFLFEPHDASYPYRIRVGWYRTPEVPRAGECWRFELRMRTPHGSLNPGGFDYEGWLFRQGIGATATVRSAERCAFPRRDRILEARQAIVEDIGRALPEHPALAFVTALAVGDDSGFTDADWDAFRATGTGHLVAISGFNIAIVAGAAFFLWRWLWALWPPLCLVLPAQRAALLGAAVVSGLYALLAGFEPPVQRAVLMLWIVLGAAWLHRLTQPSRVLALAWLAVLALDPLAITSPGLWLSFGAVAAIFYVSLGRLRRFGMWHGVVVLQLMLAVALVPLTMHFLHGASWVAPLLNLVAVPFFAVLTPWVLVAAAVHLVWPAAGVPLLAVAATALDAFRAALGYAAQWPDLWVAASPPAAALALALLGIVLLFAPLGVPLRALGALCLVSVLAIATPPPARDFEVTALDVGQGLAVVVRTAHHVLLYDAGPAFDDGFDAGESVVAPFVLHQGLREADLLLVSHGDRDHSGGVGALRKLLRIRREVGTEGAEPCRAGQAWEWDGVVFEVLHPAERWPGNNRSCVLRIRGPFSVLLPGDIEREAEAALVREHGAQLRSDLLIAPHHGSATSSTPEFVAAVAPRVVVHAAGWRNHFRHPRPEVAVRYAGIGARQFVTGNSGAIRVTREPVSGELDVHEWRREGAKFWNAPAEGRAGR